MLDYGGTTRKAIGLRLELAREAFGLTKAELSRRTGLTQQAIGQYESGKQRIGIDSARIIRRKLRISLDWIYEGETLGLPHEVFVEIQRRETGVAPDRSRKGRRRS